MAARRAADGALGVNDKFAAALAGEASRSVPLTGYGSSKGCIDVKQAIVASSFSGYKTNDAE
jgi:hypothetical protein